MSHELYFQVGTAFSEQATYLYKKMKSIMHQGIKTPLLLLVKILTKGEKIPKPW